MPEEYRRTTDPIIIEMHGMVKELCATVRDHVKRDEEIQAEHRAILKEQNEKLEPIVAFHKTAKTAGEWAIWALKYVSIPVLTGLGLTIFTLIKIFFVQTKTIAIP